MNFGLILLAVSSASEEASDAGSDAEDPVSVQLPPYVFINF